VVVNSFAFICLVGLFCKVVLLCCLLALFTEWWKLEILCLFLSFSVSCDFELDCSCLCTNQCERFHWQSHAGLLLWGRPS